ncbi:hypothetical protein CL619_02845 [archaeon]|nr:hypothetical protein [archaeon]
MEGTIKWYNPKNGYGFIAGEDSGDYFVHFTAIPQGLKIYPEDKVSFDPIETEKGKQAQNVQKIGEAAPKSESTEETKEEEVKEETTETEELPPVAEPVKEEAPEVVESEEPKTEDVKEETTEDEKTEEEPAAVEAEKTE